MNCDLVSKMNELIQKFQQQKIGDPDHGIRIQVLVFSRYYYQATSPSCHILVLKLYNTWLHSTEIRTMKRRPTAWSL